MTQNDPTRRTPWRHVLSRRMAVTDTVILAVTMAMSIKLRFGDEVEQVEQGPFNVNYPTFAGLIALAWLLCLWVFRTRDPHLIGDGVLEYRRVVSATVLLFGSLAIASMLFRWDMSRGFLAIMFPLGLIGLLLGRKVWRIWLRKQRKLGRSVSRALVVGSPHAARRLAMSFNGNPAVGMIVAGAWVPDAGADVAAELELSGSTIPLLGDTHDVLSALSLVHADSVIVTDSEHLGPEGMRELTWELEGVDVHLMVSPNLVDISAPRMHLGSVGGEPFIHLDQPQYNEAGTAMKGLFDASLGTLLAILAAPIVLVSAIAIKLSSPGPVFFTQTRIGRNGTPFRIIKLRTMKTNADQLLVDLLKQQGKSDVPLFKVNDDPRITRVGRLLRRYSIDELPQLVNVVKGDMSLVGPRPQRDEEVLMYDRKAHRRLTVRPGMTGLWQVSGRSNLDWEQSVRLDLYYVENWSMVGDLVILWKTVRAVLGSEGAR